jgi:hypothetical protein
MRYFLETGNSDLDFLSKLLADSMVDETSYSVGVYGPVSRPSIAVLGWDTYSGLEIIVDFLLSTNLPILKIIDDYLEKQEGEYLASCKPLRSALSYFLAKRACHKKLRDQFRLEQELERLEIDGAATFNANREYKKYLAGNLSARRQHQLIENTPPNVRRRVRRRKFKLRLLKPIAKPSQDDSSTRPK